MDTKQILKKKQIGDVQLVAEITGLTYPNVVQILKRPTTRRYKQVVDVLTKLITDRENSIKEAKQLFT